MTRTTRIIAVFFGALLVVAFLLPWFEAGIGAMKFSVSGYEILHTTTKFKKLMRYKPSPLDYFILVFPVTGIAAILFSGLLFVPQLTLLSAMAAAAYTVYRIADYGPDNVRRILGSFGLGLWISLVCLLVIFAAATVQAATRTK